MGNHAAGKAICQAAEHAVLARQPNEPALAILDRICGPYCDCDVQFESEDPGRPGRIHPEFDDDTVPHAKAALGMLMPEAFSPNGTADLPQYGAMLVPRRPERLHRL